MLHLLLEWILVTVEGAVPRGQGQRVVSPHWLTVIVWAAQLLPRAFQVWDVQMLGLGRDVVVALPCRATHCVFVGELVRRLPPFAW